MPRRKPRPRKSGRLAVAGGGVRLQHRAMGRLWRRPNRFLVGWTVLCGIALVPLVDRLRGGPFAACYAWCSLDGPMAALAIPLLIAAWGVLSIAYVVVWRRFRESR